MRRIDIEEDTQKTVNVDITPGFISQSRYQDPDKHERELTRQHLDEANSALYRFSTQQTLRRRQY